MSRISLSILFVTLTGMLMGQRIIYVNEDAIGIPDGTSWTNAYVDLQQALTDACNNPPAQVWIAKGEYYPTIPLNPDSVTFEERSVSFSLCNRLELYGGFDGTETALTERDLEANETILSGNIEHLSGRSGNSFNVIKAIQIDSTALIDGITVAHGNSTEFGLQGIPPSAGGGMYIEDSNPLIMNCKFMSNFSHSGGGIYNKNASPKITDCEFVLNNGEGAGIYNFFSDPRIVTTRFNNNSSGVGGGIYNHESYPTLISCVFENNITHYWGTMFNYSSSPSVVGCQFINNIVRVSGAAVYNTDNSNPSFIESHFYGNSAEVSGGAMYNSKSSPLLYNCIFSDNKVTDNFMDGGAMYNIDSGPNLIDCSFYSNEADDGGAVYNIRSNPIFTRGYFSGNSALHGGALENNSQSEVTLTDCTFLENNAFYDGGAVYARSNASLNITNCSFQRNGAFDGAAIYVASDSNVSIDSCTFEDNAALDFGGAIYIRFNSSPVISLSKFKDNSAGIGGGAVYLRQSDEANINNCSFIGNTAIGTIDTSGGAIFNLSSHPSITNCSFYNNNALQGSAISNSGGSHPVLTNGILWDLNSDVLNLDSSSMVATYSIIKGGFPGEGNLNEDPRYANPDSGDLTLLQESPAINAGNPDTSGLFIPSTDLAGNERIFYDTIDMGAYEYNGPLTATHEIREATIQIYPNPTKGFFRIMSSEENLFRHNPNLKIFDMQGRLVFNRSELPLNFPVTLPENLSDGIYTCQIQDEFSRMTFLLVLLR